MSKKTLGTGGRAKNGQLRRKSKFVPCADCGLGTTFVLCVACAEKVEAHKSHPARRHTMLAKDDKPGEPSAVEVSEWVQSALWQGWGK